MNNIDPVESISPLVEPIADRVHFLPEPTIDTVSSIRCGVVFVIAFWSGPARSALATFCKTLDRVDVSRAIHVYVVDTDAVPESLANWLQLDAISGMGEIFWICRGNPTARHGRLAGVCDHADATRQLLLECST